MTASTELDRSYKRFAAAPEAQDLRLGFYGALADAELWVLLDAEVTDQAIEPRLMELEDARYVLAFDREERLAAFADGVANHAALPGRALAQTLAGQGIGIALNIGVAPSETLITADVVAWLAEALATAPQTDVAEHPEALFAPSSLPERFLTVLDGRLARAGGLADTAWLAEAQYRDGRRCLFLAVTGAPLAAQGAIAGAVADAVRFFGDGAPDLDVAFFAPDHPILDRLARIGLRFELPQPQPTEHSVRAAPGSDPDKPPRIR